MARDALKHLRQRGSVRDYVKELSSLMLEIRDMSESDKLFNFLSGLKPWAQLELRRQGVHDVSSALMAADGLVDLHMSREDERDLIPSKPKKKEKENRAVEKHKDKHEDQAAGSSLKTGKVSQSFSGCFICGEQHRARDCPKRENFRVTVMKETDDNGEVARLGVMQLEDPHSTRASSSMGGGGL